MDILGLGNSRDRIDRSKSNLNESKNNDLHDSDRVPVSTDKVPEKEKVKKRTNIRDKTTIRDQSFAEIKFKSTATNMGSAEKLASNSNQEWKQPLRRQVNPETNRTEFITIRVKVINGDSEHDFNSRFPPNQQLFAYSVSQALIKKEQLSTAEASLFSLWIISEDLEIQIKQNQDLFKLVMFWNRWMLKYTHFPECQEPDHLINRYQFQYRREASLSIGMERALAQEVGVNILFGLCKYYIKTKRYITTQLEAATLAGYLLQHQHGDYDIEKTPPGYIGQSERLDQLLPNGMAIKLRAVQWEEIITVQYKTMMGIDKPNCKQGFLDFVREMPCYGCSFFPVCTELPPSGFFEFRTQKWVLGVGPSGLCVIDCDISKYVYIVKWLDLRYKGYNDQFHFFVTKNGKVRQVELITPQAAIIENLCYKCQYTWGKETGVLKAKAGDAAAATKQVMASGEMTAEERRKVNRKTMMPVKALTPVVMEQFAAAEAAATVKTNANAGSSSNRRTMMPAAIGEALAEGSRPERTNRKTFMLAAAGAGAGEEERKEKAVVLKDRRSIMPMAVKGQQLVVPVSGAMISEQEEEEKEEPVVEVKANRKIMLVSKFGGNAPSFNADVPEIVPEKLDAGKTPTTLSPPIAEPNQSRTSKSKPSTDTTADINPSILVTVIKPEHRHTIVGSKPIPVNAMKPSSVIVTAINAKIEEEKGEEEEEEEEGKGGGLKRGQMANRTNQTSSFKPLTALKTALSSSQGALSASAWEGKRSGDILGRAKGSKDSLTNKISKIVSKSAEKIAGVLGLGSQEEIPEDRVVIKLSSEEGEKLLAADYMPSQKTVPGAKKKPTTGLSTVATANVNVAEVPKPVKKQTIQALPPSRGRGRGDSDILAAFDDMQVGQSNPQSKPNPQSNPNTGSGPTAIVKGVPQSRPKLGSVSKPTADSSLLAQFDTMPIAISKTSTGTSTPPTESFSTNTHPNSSTRHTKPKSLVAGESDSNAHLGARSKASVKEKDLVKQFEEMTNESLTPALESSEAPNPPPIQLQSPIQSESAIQSESPIQSPTTSSEQETDGKLERKPSKVSKFGKADVPKTRARAASRLK